MNVTQHHIGYGQIEYEENFWTGKKDLTINGIKLQKKNKNTFVLNSDEGTKLCHVKGSFLTGTKLMIDQDVIELTAAAKWYEIACSVSIFVLILIWGNSVTLCSIIPIIGDAIGGAISGAMACVNLLLMKKVKNVGIKLLIWLGILAATFGVCFIVAEFLLMIFL